MNKPTVLSSPRNRINLDLESRSKSRFAQLTQNTEPEQLLLSHNKKPLKFEPLDSYKKEPYKPYIYNSLIVPLLKQFIVKLKRQVKLRSYKGLSSTDFSVINDPSCYSSSSLDKTMNFRAKFEEILLSILNLCPVINPFAGLKVLWDLSHLSIMLLLFFWIPLEISFYKELPVEVNLAILLFFMFDILLNFNTAYYQNGFLNFQRAAIRNYYLKNNFWGDIVTMLIFLLNFFMHSTNFSWTNMIKLAFYIKYKNMVQIYEKMIEIMKLRHTSLLDLFNLLSFSFFILHVFACLWYLIAVLYAEYISSQTWLLKQANLRDEGDLVKYIYSLYWATVTIMTVGYGDISACNSIEVLFSTITIFAGCVVFGYIINTVGSIIGEINKEKSLFKQNISIINKYMERKKITPNLQMKIRAYLRFLWQEEFTQNAEMEQEIISKLSGSLKEELLLEAHGTILNKFPMFYANFSENLLKQLLYKIKEIRLTPEDLIFSENDQDSLDIYLILKGKVQLFLGSKENNNTVIRNLKEGECFGEISFFSNLPRTASAQSKDFTTLFYIKHEDFLQLLSQNPEDYEKYCMIKDQITLLKNYNSLGVRCFSCQEPGHLIRECYRLHYVVDQERIIKSTKGGEPKKVLLKSRNSHVLRARNERFNARRDIVMVVEAREKYLNQNEEFLLTESLSLKNEGSFEEDISLKECINSFSKERPKHFRSLTQNGITNENIEGNLGLLDMPIKRPKTQFQKNMALYNHNNNNNSINSDKSLSSNPKTSTHSIEESKNNNNNSFTIADLPAIDPFFFTKTPKSPNPFDIDLPVLPKPFHLPPFFKHKSEHMKIQTTPLKALNNHEKDPPKSSQFLYDPPNSLPSKPPFQNIRLSSIEARSPTLRKPTRKLTPNSNITGFSPLNEINFFPLTPQNNRLDLGSYFEKMYNYKNYYPDGNCLVVIAGLNFSEHKQKRNEFLKNNNHLANYFKRTKTLILPVSPLKKNSLWKGKIVPMERFSTISPLDTRTNRRSSNIFREKVDTKVFFQKSKKLTFLDVVYQVLTNKELRKQLQAIKERNKREKGKKNRNKRE